MYKSCGYSGGCTNSPTGGLPNLETPMYFRSPSYLESKVASAHFYRSMAYSSMFDFGFRQAFYAGVSAIEKYLVRNAVRMQVNAEYSAGSKSLDYHLLSDEYSSQFTTTAGGMIHEPEILLLHDRPITEFIENITPAMKRKISTTFKLTTGFELPEKILISVLNEAALEQEHRKHSRRWTREIQGFECFLCS